MPIELSRLNALCRAADAYERAFNLLLAKMEGAIAMPLPPEQRIAIIHQHLQMATIPKQAIATVAVENAYYKKNHKRVANNTSSARVYRQRQQIERDQRAEATEDTYPPENATGPQMGLQQTGIQRDQALARYLDAQQDGACGPDCGSIHDDISSLDLGLGLTGPSPEPAQPIKLTLPEPMTPAEGRALAASPDYRPPPHILAQMDQSLVRANGWDRPGQTAPTPAPTDATPAPDATAP